MAERRIPPRTSAQAHEWCRLQAPAAGFRDGAIINHIVNKLQLTRDDKSILHVGCGSGSLTIAVYKCIRALTRDPARIVGLDHCQPLLDKTAAELQRAAQASEVNGHDVSQTIQLHRMDVMAISDPHNLTVLRQAFPHGPDLIIAVGVFDDIASPVAQAAIRDLVALQPSGGRFILETRHQPVCCSSIQLFKCINSTKRLVGIFNLAPEEAIAKLEQDTRRHVQAVAGHSDVHIPDEPPQSSSSSAASPDVLWSRQDITVYNIRSQFMGSVWSDFARQTSPPDGSPAHLGIPLNCVASFFPAQQTEPRVSNTSDPQVTYFDSVFRYLSAAVRKVLWAEDQLMAQHNIQHEDNDRYTPLLDLFYGPEGFDKINFFLLQYLHDGNIPAAHDYGPNFAAVTQVIRSCEQEVITRDLAPPHDSFRLAPASVLTMFTKD